MFFRGDERFLAKSRYRFIVPKAELSYNDLVDSIYDAIDKEVEATGGQASDDENPYFVKSYEELMEDARVLWININKANKANEALKILEDVFGRPIRFSEISADETEKFSDALRLIADLI